jgi:hypothetical protein
MQLYFFSSIVVFTPNGQLLNCGAIAFSERYNLARELENKVMKNELIPVGNRICIETEPL